MVKLTKGQLDPRISVSGPGVERILNVLLLAIHEEKKLLLLEEQVGEQIIEIEEEQPEHCVSHGPKPMVAFQVRVEIREPNKIRSFRMHVLLSDTDFVIKGRASRHSHEPTHDFFIETAGGCMKPGQSIGDLGIEENGLIMLFKNISPYVDELPWAATELLKGKT